MWLRHNHDCGYQMPLPARSTALLAALVGLAGCGFFGSGSDDKLPPICPSLRLLPDAADVTRYRSSARDLTEIVADARISAVPAQCARDSTNVVKTTLQVRVSITRGPAATTRQAAFGYVVTVLDGEQIVDQQDYSVQATFPSNVDRLDVTGDQIRLLFPVSAQKPASAYKIYVALRLTPEELEDNRRRSPR
jgi:hypothetical protein